MEMRGENLLSCGDAEGAVTSFRTMVEASTSASDKAKGNLGLARAYLKLGQYQKSMDAVYAARRLCDLGPLKETADRIFGHAAFRDRDYSLARGYLEKGLASAGGAERQVILAELSVCARRSYEAKTADRYLAEIQKPYGPEVLEVLRDAPESRPGGSSRGGGSIVQIPGPKPENEWHPPVEPLGGVIPRASWGARPVYTARVDPMGKIFRLTIHHTGGPCFYGSSAPESANEIRKIQRYHQNENQWADIGYHFIVDRAGRIWEGRPIIYQGAHAHGNANRGNIGIVVLGNYMQQEMNAAEVRSLRNLVTRLCGEYAIPPTRVYTHGEIRRGLTDCPGPAVTRVVQDIRRGLIVSSRHAD
jgi:hypothetical protein